ncbi:MAG: PilW family protein [Nitrosomonadales bacterium]|nr:PilW family protein [Nitrosomonadales bacterium]
MKSNNLYLRFPQRQISQAGFTLVEIMVGLAIGMLATLVILQVFSVFESQKRATTGTADALTNGNIGLFRIMRDMEASGYSLIPLTTFYSPLMCALPLTIAASGVSDIFPVSASDAVGANSSDSLVIRYGDSQMGGVPTPITIAGNPVTVPSSFGCRQGDIALVMNQAACTVSSATAVTPSVNNATPGTVTLTDTTNAVVGATLSCLGAWHEVTYRVRNDALVHNLLERQDTAGPGGNAFEAMVANIVNLQVQYGISAAAINNQIVQWVDPTGVWAVPSVANRNLIKAVRIAVVARDAKIEPTNVTSPCSSLTAAAPTGLCAWDATSVAPLIASPAPAIILADPDWQRYRYRVFETIIPLRNVNWSRSFLR